MFLVFPSSESNNLDYLQKTYLDFLISIYIEGTISQSDRKILITNIQNLSPDEVLLNRFFFKALSMKDFDIISALIIAKKINISIVDENGLPALFYSCEFDDFEITRLLLENGACVNFRNDKGDTPLMQATIYSSVEILSLLIFYRALINDKNLEGTSALMYAISLKEYEKAKILIKNRANVNDSDNKGITILMEAILKIGKNLDASDLDMIRFILDKIEYIDEKDSLGETALMKTQNAQIALELLNNGASLKTRNLKGQTPLLVAAKLGLNDLIDLYISRGANLLDTDNIGWSALMFAANTHEEISTLLKVLQYSWNIVKVLPFSWERLSAIINHRSYSNQSALKIAMDINNTAAKIALKQYGALLDDKENTDINSFNEGKIEIVEFR